MYEVELKKYFLYDTEKDKFIKAFPDPDHPEWNTRGRWSGHDEFVEAESWDYIIQAVWYLANDHDDIKIRKEVNNAVNKGIFRIIESVDGSPDYQTEQDYQDWFWELPEELREKF